MELPHSSSWISLITWYFLWHTLPFVPAASVMKSRRSSHSCSVVFLCGDCSSTQSPRGFLRFFLCNAVRNKPRVVAVDPPQGHGLRSWEEKGTTVFGFATNSLLSRYAAHTLTLSQRRSIPRASLKLLLPLPTSNSARRYHTEDVLNPCDFLRTFSHKGILTQHYLFP